MKTRRPWFWPAALVLATVAYAPTAGATTITIVDVDPPGQGLNDPTPRAPVGGNTGTTLGEQRLNAYQYAATLWASVLDSSVPIEIDASFQDFGCGTGGVLLGAGGPKTAHRDFAGALLPETWYVQALANKLAGTDLDPSTSDIQTFFNAALETGCRFTWYYGLDGAASGTSIDFVTVVTHEIGHGLGFLSLVDPGSGTLFAGRNDAYSVQLENHLTGLLYPNMENTQRYYSAVATGNLHWIGQFGVAASGAAVDGVSPEGHIEMYAPSPVQYGSSVSHVSNDLTPNELMEPFFTDAIHDPGLALPILLDTGWSGQIAPCGDGTLDSGEECDDANNVFGDCCSAFCRLEVSHSPCTPAGLCAADAGCDGAGTCVDGTQPRSCFDSWQCTTDSCNASVGCVHDLNGIPCNDEFVVNTFTPGNQRHPSVAAAADGGFLVVWQNDLGLLNTEIQGRLFGPEGFAPLDEFSANSYTSGRQLEPQVCADGAGNFVVTWSGQGDGDYDGVFARRFSPSAAPIGTEFLVNTHTEGLQGIEGTALGCASDGSFVVAWTDSEGNDGSYHSVQAQRFDTSATPQGPSSR
jgi:cysteine-rich repeat protein